MTGRKLALIALILLSPALHAERVDQLPVPLPASHVADPRGLLAADTRAELDRLASTLDRAGRGELGFVVIASTEGVDARRFATEVFNRWGIGDRQRNDGTLILLAKDDRAAEIVLGSGIDNGVNRQHAERVMQGAMVPRFKQGNYDQALVAGTTQLLQSVYAIDLSRPVEQAPADEPGRPTGLARSRAARRRPMRPQLLTARPHPESTPASRPRQPHRRQAHPCRASHRRRRQRSPRTPVFWWLASASWRPCSAARCG
ncbi:MAG: TPM domain-containing protein [Rhodanobacteraceae bacterium]|nr:TPM domain-containing protein [Rhodanobacteraceae bacterium]